MRKYAIAIMASVALLAACNKDDKPVVEKEPEREVVVEEVTYTMPFSGEQVAEEPMLRPILVTMNNHPAARPQSGIGSADVVYEMLAEGDVTRFLALYQSKIPTNIGPIRSARSYFVEIAQGLDAFYIAHGYSPEAKTMLFNGSVDQINGMQYDGSLFKRSRDRKAPHNSYLPGENVVAAAEKVDASLVYNKKVTYSFYDKEESVKIGMAAPKIEMNYSRSASFNSQYNYDEAEGVYTRQANDSLTVDALTDEPVKLANVLFFEATHRIIDQEGRRDIDITSGGKAYVAQQGALREVRWENRDGVLVAIEEDGSEVKLVPGQTWIHLVPASPGLATSVIY